VKLDAQTTDAQFTQIQVAFSAAATRYDQAAHIQRQAAEQFAQWLATQPIASPQTILEVGCGTGFLTAQLVERYPQTSILATDIAPAMLAQAQQRITAPQVQWQVLDAQQGAPQASDWLVSALCFQWFQPLAEALQKLWEKTEVLAFSVVLADSFRDWRAAHDALQLSCGLQPLPSWENLHALCSALQPASSLTSERVSLLETHANALAFAQSMKAIGAHVPRAEHEPAGLRSPLRQVLKVLPQPYTVNYEIGFFCLRKNKEKK
jgi:malonyl-CoA O-methyltransferase